MTIFGCLLCLTPVGDFEKCIGIQTINARWKNGNES